MSRKYHIYLFTLMICIIIPVNKIFTQGQEARIDSLVNLLKSAGREWNNYAGPLIEIGEPAIPALVRVAENKNLPQWNRRITAMTLNNIHSVLWVKPALRILFDKNEDPVLRNHVTAGLKGFNLSAVNEELWKLYEEYSNESYKLNIAYLLMTSDTAMAYRSFYELYNNCDGHIQKSALLNLATLRPEESTRWFLDAIRINDWLTANMAMDSLISTRHFSADRLLTLYNESGISEDIRWRIVYIFGHRNEPESVPLLLEAFTDKSWLVHTEAAVCLCTFDPEQIIPEMKTLKNDPGEYIRNNSRWVIRQMKNQ